MFSPYPCGCYDERADEWWEVKQLTGIIGTSKAAAYKALSTSAEMSGSRIFTLKKCEKQASLKTFATVYSSGTPGSSIFTYRVVDLFPLLPMEIY